MKLSFTERNELLEIRIGDTVFATGGGNLWTAEFQATGAQANNACTVSATQAADFSRDGAEAVRDDGESCAVRRAMREG